MRRLRTVRRLREDASGFTLVELLVAMVVIATVLLGLIGVQVRALAGVTVAKQRQGATALANRTMEQLRALPYDTVRAGLNSGELAGDPNIVSGRFRPAYDPSIDEVVQASPGQTTPPLSPHVQTSTDTTLGNVQYTVRSYVTLVGATADSGYWLTVIVTWASNATNNATKTVASRSRLFSPSGCLSTATHPFSGPCQAFHYGNSGSTPAGITVQTAGAPGSAPITGLDFTSGQVALPSLSSSVQSEQTTAAQAKAVTSGAQLVRSSGSSTSGQQAATSAADTDPSSSSGSSAPTVTTVTQSGGALTASGLTASISMVPATADSGAAFATTSAAASPACENLTGAAVVTGQPCGSARLTPNGTASAVLDLISPVGRDLPAFPLASVAAAAGPGRAWSGRFTAPSGTVCPTTSGVGCTAAEVARSFGAVAIGSTPPAIVGDTVPAGFTGMARVTGYADVARAESGTGAGTPDARRTAGTVEYWNGAGYTTLDLTNPAAVGSYPMAAATSTYLVALGQPLTITTSGQVSVAAPTTRVDGAAPCQPIACRTRSTTPGVTASVTYDVVLSGTRVAFFTVSLDLGQALATAAYKAAPSA